ncbi:MAG: hypothetical protein A2Y56_10270 [Candidatus Aminicenantes bacterium RBG_13_63_10]|nr:MAG: hypothetical protein A2Y56_10270 [Candidatus Aminicenantes bacterium RBG_13_63_10]
MIDILPTLLEACGLTTDQDIQGRSLLPLCSSEDAPDLRERVVLSETHQGVVSILEGRYKYIFYPRQNREELYDLEKDPKEKVNGIDLWPEVRDSFRKKREDLVILARNYGKRRSPEEKIVISDKDIERLHALGYLR